MLKRAFGAASSFLIAGAAIGCGDSSLQTPDDTVGESTAALGTASPEAGEIDDVDVADDAADEDAADDDAAADPADPNYIVYYVPLSNTALFRDVSAFLQLFKSEATNLPPHVSVTGFFSSSQSPTAAASTFRGVVNGVGVPFGNPPTVGSVHCRTVINAVAPGLAIKEYLVDIHLTFTGKKWNAFRTSLNNTFSIAKAKRRDVANYHVTLFETPTSTISHKRFKQVCDAAKAKFPASKNQTNYGGTPFGTALFQQAGSGVIEVLMTSFKVTK